VSLAIRLAENGTLTISGVGDPIELWRATRDFYLARRPVRREPRGRYPETTNRDVRQLAEVWRRVFKQIWRDDLEPFAGRDQIWAKHQRAIDRLLFASFDDERFADNPSFWFTWTRKPSVWLSVMRDQPSRWDLVVDAATQTITHLPEALADRASDVASAAATVGYRAGQIVAAPVRGAASGLFGKLATPLLIAAVVVGGVVLVPRLWPKGQAEKASVS
jgi:hypothetical protein